jgi:Kinesin motor domain
VQVAALLERAMKHRAVGATALNEHSSRSHMVFMLSISGRNTASGQTVSGAPARPGLGHSGYCSSGSMLHTLPPCIADVQRPSNGNVLHICERTIIFVGTLLAPQAR